MLRANVGTGALLALMTWLASLGFTTPGVAFLLAVGALAVYARVTRDRRPPRAGSSKIRGGLPRRAAGENDGSQERLIDGVQGSGPCAPRTWQAAVRASVVSTGGAGNGALSFPTRLMSTRELWTTLPRA